MSTLATDAIVIPEESSISAVSWEAIAAGAVVSAAFSAALRRFDESPKCRADIEYEYRW